MENVQCPVKKSHKFLTYLNPGRCSLLYLLTTRRLKTFQKFLLEEYVTQNGALLKISHSKNLLLIFLVNGGLITVNQLQWIPRESFRQLALFNLSLFLTQLYIRFPRTLFAKNISTKKKKKKLFINRFVKKLTFLALALNQSESVLVVC